MEDLVQSSEEDEPDLVEVDLECICGEQRTEVFPGDMNARRALASVVCGSCGRKGAVTLFTAIIHPESRDPEERA